MAALFLMKIGCLFVNIVQICGMEVCILRTINTSAASVHLTCSLKSGCVFCFVEECSNAQSIPSEGKVIIEKTVELTGFG